MLAYVLAIAVAIGSFTFYLVAFFVPEMHRRQDFFWSGLGLFYAVVLWFCAGRITGAVLLGQMASVALLGGLGWHTLSLRRSLTPELVRTPITWEDLQRWVGALQKYLRLGSLGSGIKTLMEDGGRMIATLRRNTAGPYALESSADEVPPLKRSPAYEFETTPGEGESIPSELATATPPLRPAASTVAATPVSLPLRDRPSPEPIAAAREVAESPSSQPTSRPSAPQTRVLETTATRSPQSRSGLGGWIGEVVKRVRQPKPARSVIEIPPRPPSIPRQDAPAPPPWKPTSPQAEEANDNWVDVGDGAEDGSARPEEPGAPAPKREVELEQPQQNEISQGGIRASREPRASQPASPQRSPIPPEDTNWPDEEETNWPD